MNDNRTFTFKLYKDKYGRLFQYAEGDKPPVAMEEVPAEYETPKPKAKSTGEGKKKPTRKGKTAKAE